MAYFVSLLVRPGDAYWTWLDGWVVCGSSSPAAPSVSTGGSSGARAGRRLALGFSLLAWAIGDVVLTAQSIGGAAADASLADAFYLTFYPLAYVASSCSCGEVRR